MSKKSDNKLKIQDRFNGSEPVWEGLAADPMDSKVLSTYSWAVQWYNSMSDEKDHTIWVARWMRDNDYAKESIESIKKLSSMSIYPDEFEGFPLGMKLGPTARMLSLGAALLPKQISDLQLGIGLLMEKSKKIKQLSTISPTKSDIQTNIRAHIGELIGELELLVDDILSEKGIENWDATTYISSKNIKPQQSHAIAEWFSKQMKDVTDVLCGKADDQLLEGYSVFKKQTLKKYKEWLESLVVTFGEAKRKTPTRKAKRRKSPIDCVKNMKWQKSDDGVDSVHPSRIVGAAKVILFNTKTRTVTLLECESNYGLDVSGTSIVGFDAKSSKCKKIRKPKDFIKSAKGIGIRAFKSLFDGVKSVESEGKGRTNENTIILAVYDQ